MFLVNRRQFIKSAGFGAAALALSGLGFPKSKSRPNILFILADDLGWSQLG
jgi:hypothetical protein